MTFQKEIFGKFLEKFRARAEERSIDSFIKIETALLDRVEERHFCCLGRQLGVSVLQTSGTTLAVETGGFDVCQIRKKCESNQVESVASFAGGGVRRQEGLPGLPQEPNANVKRT